MTATSNGGGGEGSSNTSTTTTQPQLTREDFINGYDPSRFDKLLYDYFTDVYRTQGAGHALVPPFVIDFMFNGFESTRSKAKQKAIHKWLTSTLTPERVGWVENRVGHYEPWAKRAKAEMDAGRPPGSSDDNLIFWSLVMRMQIIYGILIGPPRPRSAYVDQQIHTVQLHLYGSATKEKDGFVQNDTVLYWLHMHADTHISLMVAMENENEWKDADLAKADDGILKTYLPHNAMCFHEGLLKDVSSYMFQLGLWGSSKDDVTRKLVPLVHLTTKALPMRCFIRNLMPIFGTYARQDEALYEVVISWLVASLLGAYRRVRVRPGLEARKTIYRMFFFHDLDRDYVLEWLNPSRFYDMTRDELLEEYEKIHPNAFNNWKKAMESGGNINDDLEFCSSSGGIGGKGGTSTRGKRSGNKTPRKDLPDEREKMVLLGRIGPDDPIPQKQRNQRSRKRAKKDGEDPTAISISSGSEENGEGEGEGDDDNNNNSGGDDSDSDFGPRTRRNNLTKERSNQQDDSEVETEDDDEEMYSSSDSDRDYIESQGEEADELDYEASGSEEETNSNTRRKSKRAGGTTKGKLDSTDPPTPPPTEFPSWDEGVYNKNVAKGLGGMKLKPRSRGGRKRKHPPSIKASNLNHQRLINYSIKEAIIKSLEVMPYLKEALESNKGNGIRFEAVVHGTMDEVRYLLHKQIPELSASSPHTINLKAFDGISRLIESNSTLLPKQLYSSVVDSFAKFVDNTIIHKIDDLRFVQAASGKDKQVGGYYDDYVKERLGKGALEDQGSYVRSAKAFLMKRLDVLSTVEDKYQNFLKRFEGVVYQYVKECGIKKEKPSIEILLKCDVPQVVVMNVARMQKEYDDFGKRSKVRAIMEALTPYCYEAVRYFYCTCYSFESVKLYPLPPCMSSRLKRTLIREYCPNYIGSMEDADKVLPENAGTRLFCMRCRQPKCLVVKPGGDPAVHQIGHECTLVDFSLGPSDPRVYCTKRNTQKRHRGRKSTTLTSSHTATISKEQVEKDFRKKSKASRKICIYQDCNNNPLERYNLREHMILFFGRLLMLCPECGTFMAFNQHRFYGDRISCGSCRAATLDKDDPMPGSCVALTIASLKRKNEKRARNTVTNATNTSGGNNSSSEDEFNPEIDKRCYYCNGFIRPYKRTHKGWATYEVGSFNPPGVEPLAPAQPSSDGTPPILTTSYTLCKKHNPGWIKRSEHLYSLQTVLKGLSEKWRGVRIGKSGELVPVMRRVKSVYTNRL